MSGRPAGERLGGGAAAAAAHGGAGRDAHRAARPGDAAGCGGARGRPREQVRVLRRHRARPPQPGHWLQRPPGGCALRLLPCYYRVTIDIIGVVGSMLKAGSNVASLKLASVACGVAAWPVAGICVSNHRTPTTTGVHNSPVHAAQVRLWDIEYRRVVSRLAGHGGWVWCLEPHPTLSNTLLSGATDGAAPMSTHPNVLKVVSGAMNDVRRRMLARCHS
jgi:hypothetical protein